MERSGGDAITEHVRKASVFSRTLRGLEGPTVILGESEIVNRILDLGRYCHVSYYGYLDFFKKILVIWVDDLS